MYFLKLNIDGNESKEQILSFKASFFMVFLSVLLLIVEMCICVCILSNILYAI